MTEHDPHSSPIKTPKQLIIVVVLAFIVPIVIIGLLSQLLHQHAGTTRRGDEQRVLERIKPVGTVVIADASAPHGNLTGEQVYGAGVQDVSRSRPRRRAEDRRQGGVGDRGSRRARRRSSSTRSPASRARPA